MRIRTRIAGALLATSVVPLAAALVFGGWAGARVASDAQERDLRAVAASASAQLADACAAAGNRAALLATRLQLAAAVALAAGRDPADAVAVEAALAVVSVGRRDLDGATVVVLADGTESASGVLGPRLAAAFREEEDRAPERGGDSVGGNGAPREAPDARPGDAEPPPSCSTAADQDPRSVAVGGFELLDDTTPVIGEGVVVVVGDEAVGVAIVAVPVDRVLDVSLAAAGPAPGTGLVVAVPAGRRSPVLAATDGRLSGPDAAAELSALARDVTATAALPGGGATTRTERVGDRVVAVHAARGVPGEVVTVAVAPDTPLVPNTPLLVAVALLAVAAVAGAVILLAGALTRSVARVAGVARLLAGRPLAGDPAGGHDEDGRSERAGPDAGASTGAGRVDDLPGELDELAGAPEGEVREVSGAIGDLVRGLRQSEADMARARGAVVGAVGRFGASLEGPSQQDELMRAVAEAALVAADARLAVVAVEGAPASHAVPDAGPSTSSRTAGGSAGTSLDDPAGAAEQLPGTAPDTVAVFLAGGPDWSVTAGTPVVLTGDPAATDLRHPDDLDAATRGMRLLRDLAAHAVATGRAASADVRDEGSGLVVPMRVDRPGAAPATGYVAVARDAAATPLDAGARALVATLARHAAVALATVGRHRRAALQSLTDPLTGVGNLRHLQSTLVREIERASRFGHSLGVLMVDVDRFKSVNDTYGHGRGDLVLVELARRLRGCVRDIDVVARYGGEEFCLVLPETGPEGAAVVARRVLDAVSAEPFTTPDAPDVRLTVSVGVASYPEHGLASRDLMREADRALYAAKRGGRDRMVQADAVIDLTAGGAATRRAPVAAADVDSVSVDPVVDPVSVVPAQPGPPAEDAASDGASTRGALG